MPRFQILPTEERFYDLFEQHANTWTPKKEDARKFATAEEAKSFIIVWRLTDGALVERV